MRALLSIDLFCEVIDNYGDAGVCWRLARSLAQAGCTLTLWIDNPERLRRLRPQLDPARDAQPLDGFTLRRWRDPPYAGAELVISAFGCRLPDAYLAEMAAQSPPPAWINLEYLSAEDWVEGSHCLPSPHPRLPLTQHFFFPGFTTKSGGLIRESGLAAAREAFGAPQRAALLAGLGIDAPQDALLVSLFCYPGAPLPALFEAMASGPRVVCVVPEGVTPLAPPPGQSLTQGALTLHGLPFLEPDVYDRLLWSCDLNFVRGEDSAVRAQWARRPFVWQLYPQQDAAHLDKMQAFLDRYGEALAPQAAAELGRFFRAWNGDPAVALDWPACVTLLPTVEAHAARWERQLASLDDLGSSLVEFASKIR
jgi:uncharacterized repeat protein (TIGR03837 family)